MTKKKTYFKWDGSHKEHKFIDYSAIAMFEGTSLSITGLDTMELVTAITTTLSWSGVVITSSITGKSITITGSGMNVSDGDILFLENVEYPIIEDVSMALKAAAPSSRKVKKFGNLFLGAVVDGSLSLRSAGSGGTATSA